MSIMVKATGFVKINARDLSFNQINHLPITQVRRVAIELLKEIRQLDVPIDARSAVTEHPDAVPEPIKRNSSSYDNGHLGNKYTGATSKYIGVHWETKVAKWRAKINPHHIGLFVDEVEAAKAVDAYLDKVNDTKRPRNFPGAHHETKK